MNIEDLKDNLKSQLSQTWSRIEDSSFYNQMRDRFENLSPSAQKLTLMATGALIALIVISIPWSYYSTSTDYVTTYEEKRALIRELLKVTRESSEVPDLPPAPPADILRNNIENQLRMANLLPEQMKGIEVIAAETSLIPKALLESGLRVSLSKLNLRQIIDIGYNLQSISPSLKMNDMNITANPEEASYFDVEYKLVSLAVPQAPAEMPDSDEDSGASKNRKPFQRGNR